MAGRRQGRQSLAALLLLGAAIPGCGEAGDLPAETRQASPRGAPAIYALLADFLAGGDPRRSLAVYNPVYDETFAARGQVGFTAIGVAGPGSRFIVRPDRPDGSDQMVINPPEGVRLTLDAVTAQLGAAKRLPGLPAIGLGWLYSIDNERRRYSVFLSADPKLSTSRVIAIEAMRPR